MTRYIENHKITLPDSLFERYASINEEDLDDYILSGYVRTCLRVNNPQNDEELSALVEKRITVWLDIDDSNPVVKVYDNNGQGFSYEGHIIRIPEAFCKEYKTKTGMHINRSDILTAIENYYKKHCDSDLTNYVIWFLSLSIETCGNLSQNEINSILGIHS